MAFAHPSGLSLKANVVWFLAGTAFYAASQWLLAITLARQSGPAAVGVFNMATAIATPVLVLSQLCLRQVMVTDVAGRYAFRDYLNLRLILTCAAFAVIVPVILILGYRGMEAAAMAAFALGRASESVSDIYYGRLQSRGRLDRVALFLVIRSFLTLSLSAAAFWLSKSLLVAALAFAAASFAAQAVVRITERSAVTDHPRRRGRWQKLYGLSLMRHATPLAFSQFFVSLNSYSPRFVLERFGGVSLVGQYGAVEYFISVGSLVVAALGQAASPQLAHANHHGDRRRFIRLTLVIAGITALVGAMAVILTMFCGKAVIQVFYGAAFMPAAAAFTPLVLGAAVSYLASIMGYVTTTIGQFSGLTWRSIVVLVASVVAAAVGVSLYGLAGMSISSGVSGAVSIGLAINFLRRNAARAGKRDLARASVPQILDA